MIGRREFITVLGGAAAWPMAARAQEGMRRIGVLLGNSEGDTQAVAGLAAFTSALAGFGWTEGRNLHVEYRWSAADVGRMQAFAKEPQARSARGKLHAGDRCAPARNEDNPDRVREHI